MWRHGLVRVDTFYSCEQQVAMIISELIEGSWLLFGVQVSTKYNE